jgi:hypothetical protein
MASLEKAFKRLQEKQFHYDPHISMLLRGL